jgi:hypothetical protein
VKTQTSTSMNEKNERIPLSTPMRRTNTIQELELAQAETALISISALSSAFDDDLPEQLENDKDKKLEAELAHRAEKRRMTFSQEIWNAVTMIPTPAIGIYFVLAGKWLTEADILRANEDFVSGPLPDSSGLFSAFTDDNGCISSTYFPNMHAPPPITTIAVVMGYLLHSPCSVYYHLLCAFVLPQGVKRMDHWSRRLDQAMIHVMGLFCAYGMSGSTNFGLAVMAFSLDSMYRLLYGIPRPKRILVRMIVAFLIPLLPVAVYGQYWEVMQFFVIFGCAGWLFSTYPFGGWSHGTFHLVAAISNPIQLALSTKLLASEGAIQVAARCAVLAKG